MNDGGPRGDAAALAFLRSDVMGNLPMLKMLAADGGEARLLYREAEETGATLSASEAAIQRRAAMLLLPVTASAFDRATYPKAEWIVMLAADEAGDVAPLLATLPAHTGLVFKVTSRFVDAVRSARAIRRVSAYVSYTWPDGRDTAPDPRVSVSLTTDPLGRKLRAAMPKTLEDVLPFFDSGDARLFTISEAGMPVAGCLTFPNFGRVHEIGVLYTVPGFRHRGYARALVATAAHDLKGRDLVTRYQSIDDNDASRRVAAAAGLTPFLTLDHWVHDRSA
jgi:GNAT superfamily N-acetyltransferase